MEAKVLFAFAQKDTCQTYAMLCQKRVAFDCATVEDAQGVFQSIASKNCPQVVVLDCALEKSGGFELCKKVKKALLAKSPIVKPYLILVNTNLDNDAVNVNMDNNMRQERSFYGRESGADFVLEVGSDGLEGLVGFLECATKRAISEMENLILTQKLSKMSEITQRQNRQLKKDAITDPMTGVFNRTYLTKTFEDFRENCVRNGKHLAFIMLDIDHFKSINDTYGHHIGDLALKHFCKVVKSAMRRSDKLCRIGGEEFVVIAGVKNKVDGQILAEKIRQKLEINQFTGDENGEFYCEKKGEVSALQIPVTASIGQVVVKKRENFDQVKMRADKLLYMAKHNGRNRVETDFGRKEATILGREENVITVSFSVSA